MSTRSAANVTVIRHKEAVRLAVAVFWHLCLGIIRVWRKPRPNWEEIPQFDFSTLGYTEVRALREQKMLKRESSFGEYWQKQRIVQFLYGRTVVMEVLLVGTETIPREGESTRDYYWAPGSARYRPVQTQKKFASREEVTRFYEYHHEGRRSLSAHYVWPMAVKYFGDWVYVPEKKLKAMWPSFKPSWGIEVPTPVWPN
jgi:hypothetical protein